MQAERDHLVRFVFPQLREELLRRRIHFVDVDLRWGIVGEQDATDTCREIITECRPRFLCMLGGRYGTVPEGREISVTADEVHFAVLDAAAEKTFPLFYFRHGAPTREMDKCDAGAFREPRHGASARQLARLKREVRRAKHQPFLYRPRWNADEQRLLDLQAFGDRVARDVLATIELEFGANPPPHLDEFADENAAMEAFAEERSERFVLGSRAPVLDELLAHAAATGGDSYLCVTGAPGSGKSALIAHLSRTSALNNQPSTLLIRHFVGASPGSTDVRRTLRRLCHELKAGCPEITADIPGDPDRLRAAFAAFLTQACAKWRVVILLDAVNQFDAASHAALEWLPADLPENARVILSALEGPALEDLRRRTRGVGQIKLREIELPLLTPGDAEAIIEQFRKRYRKTFDPAQRAALLAKTDARTPLYLLAALEELRTLGIYEQISSRIAELPPTTHALFAWILDRLEGDGGFRDPAGRRIGRELVSRFAAMLGASRYGLSQRELVDLLHPGDPQGNVATLLHLLRPYLIRRGELLDFHHDQFRAAAKSRFLETGAQRQAAHTDLADYFQAMDLSARKIAELPWQLARAKAWQRLFDLLGDLVFFKAAWEADEFEVKRYWASVEKGSSLCTVDAYRVLLMTPAEARPFLLRFTADAVWNVATLLQQMGYLKEALSLNEQLVEYYRKSDDRERLSSALSNQAVILRSLGDLDKALALQQEHTRVSLELGNDDGVARGVGNQAMVLLLRGDLDGALSLLRQEEALWRKCGDKAGLMASLCGQGQVLFLQRELDNALSLLCQSERLARELGHMDGLHTTLCLQASVLGAKGDSDGALALLEQSRNICRDVGNKRGLAAALNSEALIHHERGDADLALARSQEAARLCREVGDKVGLRTVLPIQALILQARGDTQGALGLYAEEAQICQELGVPRRKDESPAAQAIVQSALKELLDLGAKRTSDQATAVLPEQRTWDPVEAERIANASIGRNSSQEAHVLYRQGKFSEAAACFAEDVRNARVLGQRPWLAASLGALASMHQEVGDTKTALSMFAEKKTVCRELSDSKGVADCLYSQAMITHQLGDPAGALPMLEEGTLVCRSANYDAVLDLCLGVQAQIHHDAGRAEQALALLRELESRTRESRAGKKRWWQFWK